MSQKFVSDTGRDWDKWLPFLMFAYREVPQASTGFLPFELMYGWPVQGPLDILKRAWTKAPAESEERSIVKLILEMRDRLEKYRDQARENLQAQATQKRWYDQQARVWHFQPGQKVLLLLPTSSNKLLSKWQGPYTIVRKMGPVTYKVHHPDKKKSYQTYHMNLLKEWKEGSVAAKEASLMVRKVVKEMEDDGSATEVSPQRNPGTVMLNHLDGPQQKELRDLLGRFPSFFQQRPGQTELVHHTIHLTDTTPSRQRHYRIPERLLNPLKAEIETMGHRGFHQ